MALLTPRLLGAALAGLVSIATAHAQSSIADCEKITAADAYNQCLAKFGPTSKVKSLEPERPGDVKSSSADAAAGAGPVKGASAGASRGHRASARRGRRGRGGSRATRHGGGRRHMTFTVRRRHR